MGASRSSWKDGNMTSFLDFVWPFQITKKATHSLAILEGLSKISTSVRDGDNPVIGDVRSIMQLVQDGTGLTSHEEKLWDSVHTYT